MTAVDIGNKNKELLMEWYFHEDISQIIGILENKNIKYKCPHEGFIRVETEKYIYNIFRYERNYEFADLFLFKFENFEFK